MGGGNTNRPEVAKRMRQRSFGAQADSTSGGAGLSAARAELESPVCERDQTVAFRLRGEAEIGAAVRLVRGMPPVLVGVESTVGALSDPRQAATLTACMDSGYVVVGEVVAVDAELGEGLASVVGVRSG